MLNRFIPRTVLVLHADDFPNVGMQPLHYGVSVHRGVIVQGDADHATRVLRWRDPLRAVLRAQVLVAPEPYGTGVEHAAGVARPPCYRVRWGTNTRARRVAPAAS